MKMFFALAIACVALAVVPSQASSQIRPAVPTVPAGGLTTALDEALYSEGGNLCDQRLTAKMLAGVQKLYGQRIAKLKASYFRWHGADSPVSVIRIMSCKKFRAPFNKKQYIEDQVAGFDHVLTELERRYANPPDARQTP